MFVGSFCHFLRFTESFWFYNRFTKGSRMYARIIKAVWCFIQDFLDTEGFYMLYGGFSRVY